MTAVMFLGSLERVHELLSETEVVGHSEKQALTPGRISGWARLLSRS